MGIFTVIDANGPNDQSADVERFEALEKGHDGFLNLHGQIDQLEHDMTRALMLMHDDRMKWRNLAETAKQEIERLKKEHEEFRAIAGEATADLVKERDRAVRENSMLWARLEHVGATARGEFKPPTIDALRKAQGLAPLDESKGKGGEQ